MTGAGGGRNQKRFMRDVSQPKPMVSETFLKHFPANTQMQKLFKAKMFMRGNKGRFNLSPQKPSHTSLCLLADDFTNS